MVFLSFLSGAVFVPGLEADDFQDFLTLRLAGNTGFLVGKTSSQDGFCEGQRKGCERHKVFGSSKALLLISVPQVILALWCLAATKTGIFVVLSAGILFSKFLFCAAAAFGMTIALVILYCDLCARSGIREAAVSAFVNACAAVSFLAAASVSLHGHVLGLRIVLTARIVEMAMCARQAFESQREAGHRLASSPAVGTGVQATGRVDVPGEASDELHMLKVAAAPCTTNLQQASALSERYGGGPVGKDSFSIQIFVRDLSGKTLSLQVSSRATGSELFFTVSGITGVPPEFFYLTIGGRIFGDCDFLGKFGVSSGTHVQMNGRMRGGARPPAVFIPGQWTCGTCGMEGCWPARTRCYRCNAPRSGGTSPPGFSGWARREKVPILANLLLPSLCLLIRLGELRVVPPSSNPRLLLTRLLVLFQLAPHWEVHSYKVCFSCCASLNGDGDDHITPDDLPEDTGRGRSGS